MFQFLIVFVLRATGASHHRVKFGTDFADLLSELFHLSRKEVKAMQQTYTCYH